MMFEPTAEPRVLATAPGTDFALQLVRGLLERLSGHPPEMRASIEIFVNTRRNQKRIRDLFLEQGPGFLPRLQLVTDIADDPHLQESAGTTSWLRRRLEMARAVTALLQRDERFGARASAFDLACSLADLLDEMHGENVDPALLRNLDVTDQSGHWSRSLDFIGIIESYWRTIQNPDQEARQRLAIESLTERWTSRPPAHPVMVVGSTGSRGATQHLMCEVARLPQGAVILPCFDFDLPASVWDRLSAEAGGEEHPQYRFKAFLDRLSMTPSAVRPWRKTSFGNQPRRKLLSLALRPAPVTDQWMSEGPRLPDLTRATMHMSLLEAPDSRIEALAIALALRQAVAHGQTAALVTPDARLARRVKAALMQWSLVPFDSRGEALTQTPHGVVSRQIAAMIGDKPDSLALCALLKHPLIHARRSDGIHDRLTARLEWHLRKRGPISDPLAHLPTIADDANIAKNYRRWLVWLIDCLTPLTEQGTASFKEIATRHLQAMTSLAAGPGQQRSQILWDSESGRKALEFFDGLCRDADAGGVVSPVDYRAIFESAAARSVVFETRDCHPGIAIWNTLDARMQSPDLLIAGGLNDGTWPASPGHDSWLNRDLRTQVGLLLPERRTGLSAHDFMQSASIETVILTRSLRDESGPTVPSRWLSRLTGLLEGIGRDGVQALRDVRGRGEALVRMTRQLESPERRIGAAQRPAPAPPCAIRPKGLTVTEIRTLITDPYAVYARRILKLYPARPLRDISAAIMRGTLLHAVMQTYSDRTRDGLPGDPARLLLDLTDEAFAVADIGDRYRRLWRADLESIAARFVAGETVRRANTLSISTEIEGSITIPGTEVKLVAKADRVDQLSDGSTVLYDYKTGALPHPTTISLYEKQLPVMAAMIERGAFADLGENRRVSHAAYIKIGGHYDDQIVTRSSQEGDFFDATWGSVCQLVERYLDPATPYVARRAASRLTHGGDYDHLARYGEWDDTSPHHRLDLA